MTKEITTKDELTDFLLYTSPDGKVKVEAFLNEETIWLTQKQIAELFGVQRPAITKHLQNIFETGELDEKVVCSILELTSQHGAIEGKTQTKEVKYYNLDAILSVGYRVNSSQATNFRIWATKTLKEYIIKGFAMDDERLKNGQYFGKDYFQELLERVRSIRTSERRIWLKITDIFAECSTDYHDNTIENKEFKRNFYASIQNKFHFAITGQTAAEIIVSKADHEKPNMNLTTWKKSPEGRILKGDVSIAKNYLKEKEIKELERSVNGFFDYIEGLIERQKAFKMADFQKSVNGFLEFNEYKVLDGAGSVSKDEAKRKAEREYDIFNKNQPIESDFDKFAKETLEKGKK